MRVQPWHVIVLVVVIVLVFGANRLPDLARSVGQSMKIFKSEIKDLKDDPKADAGTDATAHTRTESAADTRPETVADAPARPNDQPPTA